MERTADMNNPVAKDWRSARILSCAFVAGLSIPIARFGILKLSVLWPINTPSWRFITIWTLISLGSYLVAGLLFMATPALKSFSFNWLLLSIGGAFLFAMVYTFRPLSFSQLGLSDPLPVHLWDALGTTLWLTLFTAPISALVYYSMSFVDSMRTQQLIGPERRERNTAMSNE